MKKIILQVLKDTEKMILTYEHGLSYIIMPTPPPPVGWGSTYCFIDVRVGLVRVSITPITKGTPAQIFLRGMFLFPRALAFDFCYDLDLCSQGQVVRAFFIRMGFTLILSKVQGGFRSNMSESFIDRWHMT